MSVHFSSKKDDWSTPWDLFHVCEKAYGPFSLDVCATTKNTKCQRFFSPKANGLMQPWYGVCWMNPPYGRIIEKWLKKAVIESQRGIRVVSLLPVQTDTTWWHEYVLPHGYVHFLLGRVRFQGAKRVAPFPSAIVVFG